MQQLDDCPGIKLCGEKKKKKTPKCYILYDAISTTFFKGQNFRTGK